MAQQIRVIERGNAGRRTASQVHTFSIRGTIDAVDAWLFHDEFPFRFSRGAHNPHTTLALAYAQHRDAGAIKENVPIAGVLDLGKFTALARGQIKSGKGQPLWVSLRQSTEC